MTGVVFTLVSLFAAVVAVTRGGVVTVFVVALGLSLTLIALLATGVARAHLAGSLWLALFLAVGLALLEVIRYWNIPGVGELVVVASYLLAAWLLASMLSRLDYGRLRRR